MLHEVYGEKREHLGNGGFSTYMCCVEAKDGMVLISPATDSIWKRFTKAIGREDMAVDTRFKRDLDRYHNTSIINEIVYKWADQKTVEDILDVLEESGVPCAPVNTPEQLLDDPQVKSREMIIHMDHPGLGKLPLQGVPIKLSETPGQVVFRAPQIGEHNTKVYCDILGFEEGKLVELKEEGII